MQVNKEIRRAVANQLTDFKKYWTDTNLDQCASYLEAEIKLHR